jgi:hypothetical protein
MKRLLVILAAVVLGGALGPSAQASSIQFTLTSGQGNQMGYLTYTIPGNPVYPPNPCTGVDLLVATITGQGTPSNSGVNFVPTTLPTKVSFTTGGFTGYDTSHWFFGGGGAIAAVTGSIDLRTLLTGSFQDPSLSSTNNGMTHEFLGTFTATLAADLLSFYGIPGNPILQGKVNIFAGTNSGIFPQGSILTDAIVSGTLTLTPVPGSLLLLGSGLLGLKGFGRRRKRA